MDNSAPLVDAAVATAGELVIGDCHVSVAAGTVRRRDRVTRLEPKVMAVLAVLARRHGQVVTKDEILRVVWPDTFVEEVALARSVSEIRKALGDDRRDPRFIETIPKKGYRLVAAVSLPAPAGVVRPGRTWIALPAAAAAMLALVAAYGAWSRGVLPADRAVVGSAPPAARDLYLKAREYYRRYGRADNENAIALFQQALEIDPAFAAARAGLADAYSQRASTHGMDPAWTDRALDEAGRAVRLAPDLPDAHKALGVAYASKGWYSRALASYERAIELRPDFGEVLHNIAYLLHRLGRWDEAVRWQRRRARLDATGPVVASNLAQLLHRLGLTDEAAPLFASALDLEPFFADAHVDLAYGELFRNRSDAARDRLHRVLAVHPACVDCLLAAGEVELIAGVPDRAAPFFERAREAAGANPYAELRLGQLRWQAGDRAAATPAIERAAAAFRAGIAAGSEDWFPRWNLAVAAAVRGRAVEALDWLEASVESGRRFYWWDEREPAFASLAGQPRFSDLMDRMRASVDAMRRRVQWGHSSLP